MSRTLLFQNCAVQFIGRDALNKWQSPIVRHSGVVKLVHERIRANRNRVHHDFNLIAGAVAQRGQALIVHALPRKGFRSAELRGWRRRYLRLRAGCSKQKQEKSGKVLKNFQEPDLQREVFLFQRRQITL
ncbi:MAG TPA: hypothetical protein VH000_01970 [Rhizomicrobium sp.]|nr:hypothetical protein [Rhizomicrobium sp.]